MMEPSGQVMASSSIAKEHSYMPFIRYDAASLMLSNGSECGLWLYQ